MPSLRPYALPAVVALLVGVAVGLTRRFTVLVVELSTSVPPTELLSWYTVGVRAVAFLLVYGLLFGVVYRLAADRSRPNDESILALAVGIAGGVGYAVVTVATVGLTDVSYPGVTFAIVATLGAGIAIGVELGVVAFAGSALARWRTDVD